MNCAWQRTICVEVTPSELCLLKQLYIALIFYLRTQQTSHIERCIPPDYLHETENQKERLD